MFWIYKIIDIKSVKRISFRKDINLLRAIAVLGVVFYHAEIKLVQGGWLGVDVFFVISGYLISNIIISQLNNQNFKFKNFYLRRIRRIIPVFYFTCFLLSVLSIVTYDYEKLLEFNNSLLPSISFLSNFYFSDLDFYTYDPIKYSFLVHSWSLAIEEQFYIIFPLLLFGFFKYQKNKLFTLMTLITFFSILLNILDSGQQKFYFIEYRFWEFAVGFLIMVVSQNTNVKSDKIPYIGVFLILFSFYFFDDSWILDIEPKLISIFGVCLILLGTNENKILDKIANLKIISIIGLSSYSIYLLHQPLFAFIRTVSNSLNRDFNITLKISSFIFLIYISNILFNKIELQYMNEESLKLIFKFIAKYLCLILFIFLSIYYSDGLKFRYDTEDFNSESGGLKLDSSGEHFGNIESDPLFVLIGDSHAGQHSKFLNKEGMTNKFSFYQYTRGNCLSLINYTNKYKFGIDGYEDCVFLFSNALSKAEELNIPVVYGNYWVYDLKSNIDGKDFPWVSSKENLDFIKNELVLSFEKYNIPKIYVLGKTIGSNNEPFSQPIKCSVDKNKKYINFFRASFFDVLNLCSSNNKAAKNRELNNLFEDFLKGYENIEFINPNLIFCEGSNCIDFVNNEYVYRNSHLSYVGSRQIMKELLDKFEIKE